MIINLLPYNVPVVVSHALEPTAVVAAEIGVTTIVVAFVVVVSSWQTVAAAAAGAEIR